VLAAPEQEFRKMQTLEEWPVHCGRCTTFGEAEQYDVVGFYRGHAPVDGSVQISRRAGECNHQRLIAASVDADMRQTATLFAASKR
jgi:hypothetical protein